MNWKKNKKKDIFYLCSRLGFRFYKLTAVAICQYACWFFFVFFGGCF